MIYNWSTVINNLKKYNLKDTIVSKLSQLRLYFMSQCCGSVIQKITMEYFIPDGTKKLRNKIFLLTSVTKKKQKTFFYNLYGRLQNRK